MVVVVVRGEQGVVRWVRAHNSIILTLIYTRREMQRQPRRYVNLDVVEIGHEKRYVSGTGMKKERGFVFLLLEVKFMSEGGT